MKKTTWTIWCYLLLQLYTATLCSETSYEDYGQYVDEVAVRFANEMFSEFGLLYAGQSGMMHEKIEDLGFNFRAHHRATLEEARILYITAMQKLVKIIEEHPNIKPFLEVKPFNYKYVSVSISFDHPSKISDGTVMEVYSIPETATAEHNRNRIFYKTEDPFIDYQTITLHTEFYEDAEKIVKDSLVVSHKDPTEEELAVDHALESFMDQIPDEYYIYTWSIGREMKEGALEIGAKFTIFAPSNIEEGRALILAISDKLLDIINADEKIKSYLKGNPLSYDSLRLRICFVDKRWTSYDEKDSIHGLSLTKDGIKYFRDRDHPYATNPLISQESYEDAVERNKNPSKALKRFAPPNFFERTWQYIKHFFLMTLVYLLHYFGGFRMI